MTTQTINTPQFGKNRATITLPDGTQIHETNTFYNGQVSGYKQELEEQIKTDNKSYLKEALDAGALITSKQTTEVTITLSGDAHGNIKMITRRYPVSKENFGRK